MSERLGEAAQDYAEKMRFSMKDLHEQIAKIESLNRDWGHILEVRQTAIDRRDSIIEFETKRAELRARYAD